MKPSVLTSMAATALLAGAPVLAQQLSAGASGPRAVSQGCVVAGPSLGDCRAAGRYSQSYRDVEGGQREDRGGAAARHEGKGSGAARAVGEAGRVEAAAAPQAAM